MNKSFLSVKNLNVEYKSQKQKIPAVFDVSFSVDKGESFGIIGESGSGKTTIAMALLNLLDNSTNTSGSVYFEGIDLLRLNQKELTNYRWKKISLSFQNSLDVLNPVLTVHEQISECLIKHTGIDKKQSDNKIFELLVSTGLEPFVAEYFPHQLSGGMRQKVLIAMAISCDPEILIVDEPTSSLDSVSRDEIINLILRLQKEKGFTTIIISHQMDIISKLSSKMMVLCKGYIVEKGVTDEIIKDPCHVYTKGLLNSSPGINPYRDLWGIPGHPSNEIIKGCPFYKRCVQHLKECETKRPLLNSISDSRMVACNRGGIIKLLEGKNISKTYAYKGNSIKACNKCSIDIYSGEVLVLMGKSGSGKTTLANILSGISKADEGEVFFEGKKVLKNSATRKKHAIQMVFQDPFSSINEHFTVLEAVSEPLDIIKSKTPQERKEVVRKALCDVQLYSCDNFLSRKCFSLSGGQRQRVALARSLVMEPSLLIADEISSMLDPSTQANILRLLKGLQNSNGFAMLYITHDFNIARKIADRIFVMKDGMCSLIPS